MPVISSKNHGGIEEIILNGKSGEKVDERLRDEIIIIICAVLMHYALEFGKKLGDYSCPEYCKVKHKHINKEKLNGFERNGNSSLFQRGKQKENDRKN